MNKGTAEDIFEKWAIMAEDLGDRKAFSYIACFLSEKEKNELMEHILRIPSEYNDYMKKDRQHV